MPTLEIKYCEKMIKLQKLYDYEVAHGEADTLLCELLTELGYKRVVEEFDKVGKWYA